MNIRPTADQEREYNSLTPLTEGEGNNKEQGSMVTGQHHWHALWLFGIILDDDGDWYIPDDEDSLLSLVTIDNPPQGAWDARPI